MDEIGIEGYISERSSRTCEFAVRTSGPRVINYDLVSILRSPSHTAQA